MIDWAIDKETAAVIDINLYSCTWKDFKVRKANVFTTYIVMGMVMGTLCNFIQRKWLAPVRSHI